MLLISFAQNDHVIEDTLGARYFLVYGTLPNCWTWRNAKKKALVLEEALVCIDREEFPEFLCYFHLVISLAQVKFAEMLTPNQIRKNILYAWQRILFCKKYWIDWDLEIATHTHTHTHTEKGKTQMPPLWTQLYVTFITRFTLWIWNILCTVLWNWLIPTKCQCNAKTNNANLWNKITILFQTSLEF